jgi:hypothetical protein
MRLLDDIQMEYIHWIAEFSEMMIFPIDIDENNVYFVQSSHKPTVYVVTDSQIPRSRHCLAK